MNHLFIFLSLLFISSLVKAENEDFLNTLTKQSTQISMPTRTRFSYEFLPLSSSEDMGIVGIHYDLFPSDTLPFIYTGLGFYGGLTGEEGGFFTMGYTLGANVEATSDINFDGGFFIGGGGGSAKTFPGSGLMLRTHGAVEYTFDVGSIKLGLARTDFPNSLNPDYETDLHAFIGLNINDTIWKSVNSKSKKGTAFKGLFSKLRISPSFMYYVIDNKPTKRADKFPIDANAYQADTVLMGLQVDRLINDNLYLTFEAYGAGKNAAGYAALHTGVGYVTPLFSNLNWENKLILGMAGDGIIDTGGGFIVQPMTGFSFSLSDTLSLKTMAGRTYAPGGRLSATTVDFAMSWQEKRADTKEGIFDFSSSSFKSLEWEVAVGNKFYFPDKSATKYTGLKYDEILSLVGIEFGTPLFKYLDAIGNTYWAYGGNIGSYAEGMFGLEAHTAPISSLKIIPTISAQVGVAGGGHMEVDGFIAQVDIGLSVPTSYGFDVELSAGKMQSSGKSFFADVVTLKLNWNQLSFFKR